MAAMARRCFRPADFIEGGLTLEGLVLSLKVRGCCNCYTIITPYEDAVVFKDKDGEEGLVHDRCLKELPSAVAQDPSPDVVRRLLGIIKEKEHCRAV